MFLGSRFKCGVISALFALIGAGCASSGPETFKSPDAAVDSLVSALRAHDTKQLNKIFGPEGEEIVSSGDEVADRAQAAKFLTAYDAQHEIVTDVTGSSTLVIGGKDWPFPVPIVDLGKGYMFDTAAGKEEILNRRIGRNELSAQQVCLAIVDAERDYVAQKPMGGDLPLYARKIMSDPGTKDGLYWPTKAGEPASPLGALIADASEEGYRRGDTSRPPPPYLGYRYKLLTSQGPNANGGAMNYEVDGKLIGGFGVVAYPAQYGNSGIMTFITNYDGTVYQQDLGPDTEKIAQNMTQFDPGAGWEKCTNVGQSEATDLASQ